MFGLRPQLSGIEQVQFGLGVTGLDQDGVRINLLYRHHLGGVVVVKPGALDVLGSHHLVTEGVVIGGDRLTIGPLGAGIQLEIDGLIVRAMAH